MGNRVAKDFHAIQVGVVERRSSMDVAPESGNKLVRRLSSRTAIDQGITIKVEREKNAVRFYKSSNPQRKLLYHVKSRNDKGRRQGESVTENGKGSLLFVTLAPDSSLRKIYRTRPVYKMQSPSYEDYDDERNDLFEAAKIEIDRSAGNISAFLSLVVGEVNGDFLYGDMYKAVKVPQVRHGALVVETEGGRVVGKASHQDGANIYEIAEGADVGAVIAVASSVL